MKKRAVSLLLAVVLCLPLAIPALAAEETTVFTDDYMEITNVTVVWDINFVDGTRPLECRAPVTIKLQKPVKGIQVTRGIEDSREVPIPELPTSRGETGEIIIPAGASVTLTEADTYYILLSEAEGGTNLYALTVAAGDTAPVQPADPAGTDPDTPAETIPASGTSYASTQTVTVDGKAVEFQMYALKDEKGNPTNYIKLRDLAQILSGTKAQFAVGYDNAAKAISVTTGEAYSPNGSEMQTPFSGDRAYTGGAKSVTVDGEAVELTAITLTDDAGGGYTYFKLRDLGKVLGFNTGWTREQGVFVESDKPYTE